MSNYTVLAEGHYTNTPEDTMTVLIALYEWDGKQDAEDERIFYYMDGAGLEVGDTLMSVLGDTIAVDFVITAIEGVYPEEDTQYLTVSPLTWPLPSAKRRIT